MVQNIKKTNKNKHHFLLFFFLILIIVATVVICLAIFKPLNLGKTNNPETSESTNTTKTEQKPDDKKEAEKTEEEKSEEIKSETEKNNSQYEGNDPNTYEGLTGIVSYFDFSEGNIRVIAHFDQFVSGTCSFSLTSPSGKTIAGSDSLVAEQSSSACEFITPSTEHGTWKVSITAAADNKRGLVAGEANL